jgi:hypothetical protein
LRRVAADALLEFPLSLNHNQVSICVVVFNSWTGLRTEYELSLFFCLAVPSDNYKGARGARVLYLLFKLILALQGRSFGKMISESSRKLSLKPPW